MQALFPGRADVHGGTFAHRFHPAEDFDGVGGVVSVGDFAVLVLRVVLSVDALAINEFGLHFFRGHSAPCKMRYPHPSGRLTLGTIPGLPGRPPTMAFSAIQRVPAL